MFWISRQLIFHGAYLSLQQQNKTNVQTTSRPIHHNLQPCLRPWEHNQGSVHPSQHHSIPCILLRELLTLFVDPASFTHHHLQLVLSLPARQPMNYCLPAVRFQPCWLRLLTQTVLPSGLTLRLHSRTFICPGKSVYLPCEWILKIPLSSLFNVFKKILSFFPHSPVSCFLHIDFPFLFSCLLSTFGSSLGLV